MVLGTKETVLVIRALSSWAEQISRMEHLLASHAMDVAGLPEKALEINTELHALRGRALELAERLAQPPGDTSLRRIPTTAAEALMRRCQRGVGGPGALDRAHDILADCYGTLGALVQERDHLRRGEAICGKCGLRHGGEPNGDPGF